MRRLAQELGCSPMTPYRYFRDKEEILAAVRAAAFNRFAETLEEAQAAQRDPAGKARAGSEAYLRFALAQPQAYRLMFDLSQPDEQRFPELTRAVARARATFTAQIDALVADGTFKGDPLLLSHAFWAALHGMVMLHLTGKLPGRPDLYSLYGEAMRLLVSGARGSGALPRPHAPVAKRGRAAPVPAVPTARARKRGRDASAPARGR
jgi:AcrR family transcriptional regulator